MPALVYVVDDEKVIAVTLVAILKNSGFDAVPFVDPLEALRAAALNAPDLLITDVRMPELNGVDLALQFKDLYPNCKVLLFSGHAATAGLLDDARDQGHRFELLTKPIHPKDLLSAIEKIIK